MQVSCPFFPAWAATIVRTPLLVLTDLIPSRLHHGVIGDVLICLDRCVSRSCLESASQKSKRDDFGGGRTTSDACQPQISPPLHLVLGGTHVLVTSLWSATVPLVRYRAAIG